MTTEKLMTCIRWHLGESFVARREHRQLCRSAEHRSQFFPQIHSVSNCVKRTSRRYLL